MNRCENSEGTKDTKFLSLFKKCRETKIKPRFRRGFFIYGDPARNRTGDSTLRGLRLNLLTTGPRKYLST